MRLIDNSTKGAASLHNWTIEQRITKELRDLIVAGDLEPGIRVRYRDLAEQFGVSVTPVRAALRELAHEGLIDARPNAANYVSPLSLDEVEQLYLTRMGFESWLAQLGTPRLSSRSLRLMEQKLKRFQTAAEKRDSEGLVDIAWKMRVVCYEAADRPSLLQKAAELYDRSRRYTHRTLMAASRHDESKIVATAFYGACLEHDGDRAAETIRQALEVTFLDLYDIIAPSLKVRVPSSA